MSRLSYAITAAALVTSAMADNVRPTEHKQIGVNDVWFNMRYVPEADQVEFIVSMNKSDNWLGLILGQDDMKEGGDMAVFFSDGEQDDWWGDFSAAGYQEPMKDVTDNLVGHPDGGVEFDEADRVTLFVRRDRDTRDPEDFVIPLDEAFKMGYTYSPQSSDLTDFTKLLTAGSLSVTLPSDGSYAWESTHEHVKDDSAK